MIANRPFVSSDEVEIILSAIKTSDAELTFIAVTAFVFWNVKPLKVELSLPAIKLTPTLVNTLSLFGRMVKILSNTKFLFEIFPRYITLKSEIFALSSITPFSSK